MSEAAKSGSYGAELEQVLHEFEQELHRAAPTGRRHARLDEDEGRIAELRMEVIRQAEALPRAVWPRPLCAECEGEREVQGLQARYADGADSPEFDTVPRPCPACAGTGITLNS